MTIQSTQVVILVPHSTFNLENLRKASDDVQKDTTEYFPGLEISQIYAQDIAGCKIPGLIGYRRGNSSLNPIAEKFIGELISCYTYYLIRCYAVDYDIDCLKSEIVTLWEISRNIDFPIYGKQAICADFKTWGYFKSHPELYPQHLKNLAE